MIGKVRKWGNSLAVRLPRSFADDADLSEGSIVNLTMADGKIVIDPRPRPRYALDELLKRVTKRNLHGEIDTGGAVGREVW